LSLPGETDSPEYNQLVGAYQRLEAKYNQLKQTADLHQIILYHAADMIAIVDARGRRIWNNQAFHDTLGYTVTELEHSDSFQEIHPDDRPRLEKIFFETVQTGIARQTEYRMKHKDGHWLRLESRARAVMSDQGTVESVVLISRDITDRYLMQLELEQARTGSLGGVISSRLGAVFDRTVERLCELVRDMRPHLTKGQEQELDIEARLHTVENSHELLVALLSMGQTTEEDWNTIRMEAIISSAVRREITTGGMARDDVVIHADLMVKGSEILLQNAVGHIIRNAVEATEKRGVVRIELMRWILNREQAVEYGGLVPGEYAAILVRDQGIGIEKEDLGRVCDPFYTTKPNHEGLGLTIADVVFSAHGGCLRVKSRRKISTEVLLLMPTVSTQDLEGQQAMESRRSQTVLIMETDGMVQSFLSRMLQDLGFNVCSAAGLHEAGERVKKGMEQRDYEKIDVVMGPFLESEDYTEWIDYMKQLNPDLRTIVTHSDGNHPGVLRYQQYGFDAALVKPLTLENIQSTLDRVMG
jgi:PAS domain S-box-containing protein